MMAAEDNSNGGGKGWEIRPGGMLVQKRTGESQAPPPPKMIRVRVKYGAVYHEIDISSQSTFGELKKLLFQQTGLHHQDQKLFYKKKERDSKAFLDIAAVKDRSKLVLVEDPISKEKRHIEMKKNCHKIMTQITLEVDKLAEQVSALETMVSEGGKVSDDDIVKLTDLLMNQLLKLDRLSANADTVSQRKLQVEKVQKCVETLDAMKLKNSTPSPTTDSSRPHPPQQQQQTGCSNDVVITTKWETFDATPVSLMDAPPSSSSAVPLETSFITWDDLL